MKHNIWLYLGILFISLNACKKETTGDDDSDTFDSKWAMTAKIDNLQFEANTIFGDNKATDNTIYTYFPDTEYFRLAGTKIYDNNILKSIEINIWLKKDNLQVGTYDVGVDSDGVLHGNRHRHHIDLTDNTNTQLGEYTISGQINITDIDTQSKKIKGTFEFIAGNHSDINATVVARVTNGTFNYDYSDISN